MMLTSSVQGVVLYDEFSRGDLSNDLRSPTTIVNGGFGDQVIGFLNPNTDVDDVFILEGLIVGQLVTFAYEHNSTSDMLPLSYTFSDGSNISKIYTTNSLPGTSVRGTSPAIEIPPSGNIHVHLNLMDIRETLTGTPEIDPPFVSWTISIESAVVPEPSTTLLLTIGSALVICRRNRLSR